MLITKRKRKKISIVLFIAPALVIYSVFRLFPAISSLFYGFTNWNGLTNDFKFVGFQNFIDIINDKVILGSLKNTVLYTVIVTIFQNLLGLLFALLLDKKTIRGKYFFRTVMFTPAVMSTAVICFMWATILNPVVGTWGDITKALGLSGVFPYDPLGSPSAALYFVMAINIWQFTGYSMLLYLTGLQSVPEEMYEAASVDGCTGFNKFRYITLPLIKPSITINLVLTTIGCLKEFEHVFVLTRGGPGNSTQVIGTAIYQVAFSDMQKYGYGIAVSTILLFAILIVTGIQLMMMSKREVEY